MKNKTLKEQNSKLIWTFFSYNVVLFYLVGLSQIVCLSKFDIASFISIRGAWVLIIPLLLFILNGIISSNLKAIIVFWKIKNPLPACRAFSYFADYDDRIDKNYLIQKFNPLPVTPKQQNSLWYKIYKEHQENPIIKKSHKDFLLARDISSIALLFFFFGGVSILIISPHAFKWLYISFLLLQYLIFAIIAQNHGNRFVCNTLAIETSKEI
jgi:hypothetical protein